MDEIPNELEGHEVLLFNKKGFRYKGKVMKISERFIEIFDFKSNQTKLIAIDDIAEVSYE